MVDVRYDSIALPDKVRESLLALVRSYDLRFAAIDLAVDRAGRWVFFEVNPNGQWAWLDLAGVCDIAASFVKVFGSRQNDV
jgi:D-alanine-D-alanine ligase-like ATP-grasp enzyme